MSSVLLERRKPAGPEPGQHPLFDDLRRAEPGPEPGRLAEPGVPGPASERGERDPRSGGDRLTLEDRLERIWEDLLAVGAAECPMCGNEMEWSAPGGACGSCGAALS